MNKISAVYKIVNTVTGDFYKGKTLTLNALVKRFRRASISHPYLEAKKYLLTQQ